MENITIKINGMEVSAPKGSTILEAARLAHIEIPTLRQQLNTCHWIHHTTTRVTCIRNHT